MSKTIVLVFHSDLRRSKANAALAAAAAALPDVDVVDMHAEYPAGIEMHRDGAREAQRLLTADRLVLQFPMQWYSTPPLLKAWQDAVLTRMFYVAYESEGRRLEGKPLLLAVTAGNDPDAYVEGGKNLLPIEYLLNPLKATAHRCGLPLSEPYVLFRANKLTAAELASAAAAYGRRLTAWAGLAELEAV